MSKKQRTILYQIFNNYFTKLNTKNVSSTLYKGLIIFKNTGFYKIPISLYLYFVYIISNKLICFVIHNYLLTRRNKR